MPTTILDGETYEQARHRRFTEEAKVIEKMQQDEIIRMAREAGFSFETGQDLRDNIPALERFAALVAAHVTEALTKAHEDAFQSYVDQAKADRELSVLAAVLSEREACAKVCETDELCCKCGDECAEAIRNRSDAS